MEQTTGLRTDEAIDHSLQINTNSMYIIHFLPYNQKLQDFIYRILLNDVVVLRFNLKYICRLSNIL